MLGRAVDRARSLSLACRLLPPPVPDRTQDQPLAYGDRPAALHARIRFRRQLERLRTSALRTLVRKLRLARFRLALPRVLSQEPRSRGRIDAAAAADRLSDRLRHGARPAALAADHIRLGGATVLDIVPDPHLRVDQHPATRRLAQSAVAGA